MAQQFVPHKHSTLPIVQKASGRIPLQQYYVPHQKNKIKSRAFSHVMEFLTRVFCAEGASRFFKTFMLRFVSGSDKGCDDSSGRLAPCARTPVAA